MQTAEFAYGNYLFPMGMGVILITTQVSLHSHSYSHNRLDVCPIPMVTFYLASLVLFVKAEVALCQAQSNSSLSEDSSTSRRSTQAGRRLTLWSAYNRCCFL